MLTYQFIQEPLRDGGKILRPKIPVVFEGTKASMKFFALLDSGADVTIIPKKIADFLGVKYSTQSLKCCYGFGKEPLYYVKGRMKILFQGNECVEELDNVPVLVALGTDEEEPILGLAEVFDNFNVNFLHRRTIELTRI